MPDAKSQPPPEDSPRKYHSGVTMLMSYVTLYGLFIYMCVFRPENMMQRVRETVTLAVAYGMLLIIVAALFALMYVRRRR